MRSNNKRTTTSAMKTPNSDLRAAIMWAGYCDARNGLPFCGDYDTWSEPMQRNYEWGRGLAAAAAGELGRSPSWPRNRHVVKMLPAELVSNEWAHHKANVAP